MHDKVLNKSTELEKVGTNGRNNVSMSNLNNAHFQFH